MKVRRSSSSSSPAAAIAAVAMIMVSSFQLLLLVASSELVTSVSYETFCLVLFCVVILCGFLCLSLCFYYYYSCLLEYFTVKNSTCEEFNL